MNRIPRRGSQGVALAIALLAFAPKTGAAAEPVERAAVEEVVAGINSARKANNPVALEALLATDLNAAERAAIVDSERAVCALARQVLSEVTVPHLNILKLRLITPDVIEVDAVNVQLGSLIMTRRWNILLILRREGSSWRISTMRSFGAADLIY
jgi:hypothetical protein